MNRVNKFLAATLMLASLLASTLASAIPLGTYEQARKDPAKQSQLLNNAFETAISRTLGALRDTHFKDGKEKSQQRIDRDKARANRVESVVVNLTNEQSAALVNMIAQYAQAQPNTELEDVISSFLLTEADKLVNQGPGNSAVSIPNNHK